MILQFCIVLMIIAALFAVETKDPLSSAIGLGTLGFSMSLSYLLLKAPDLGIILLIVELLALVALALYAGRQSAPREGEWATRLIAGGIALFFFAVCAVALRELPAIGHAYSALGRIFNEMALPRTGAASAVAAVAFDFRGYDAMAAIALLFLASLGVFTITDKKERKIK